LKWVIFDAAATRREVAGSQVQARRQLFSNIGGSEACCPGTLLLAVVEADLLKSS
jgi:hypothetical protein